MCAAESGNCTVHQVGRTYRPVVYAKHLISCSFGRGICTSPPML
jgi:hypothetical protein